MRQNRTTQPDTVDKPGESEAEQFNIEAIPEVDITYDDLEQSGENPEGWLLYGNNYRRHNFTTADIVTPNNVSDLQVEWQITDFDNVVQATGGQGTPLIVPGDPPIMYHTTAPQTVRAIDARNGEILWRYTYNSAAGHVEQRPPASRGCAVLGDTLYYSTLDLGLIALNRYTADEKWYYNGAYEYRDTKVSDFQGGRWMGNDNPDTAMHPELSYVRDRGSSSAYPPVVHDGVILKGSFGGEVGVAGWAEGIPTEEKLAEMDAEATTTETETPTESGMESPTEADTPTETETETSTETPTETETATATGTETPTETETETPTGTPSEEGEDDEPVGGEHNDPVWRLRMTPPDDWIGESWKHGGATVWQAPAVDLETGRAVLPTANPGPWFGTVRPGWNPYTAGKVAVDFQTGEYQWHFQESPHDWWDYDSPSPATIFDAEVRGEERTLVSWAGKTGWLFTMDLETGQLVSRSDPFVEHLNIWDLPTRKSEGEEAAEWIMPHLIGGTDPQPSSYDPNTQTLVGKGSNQPVKLLWEPIQYELGRDYKGMDTITGSVSQREQIDGWDEPIGNLAGFDPATGEIKWRNWYEDFLWGGSMSTTTGLSFAGIADGTFRAYDTETGEELWQDEISPGVDGNPISWFDPNTNKQYVSVAAGGSRGGGGLALTTYSLQGEGGDGGGGGE